VAQFPALLITYPTGSETINVVNGGPQIASVYLRQARDARGARVSTASSGTVTFGTGESLIVLTNASTISTLTIALTASPVDGQMNCFYSKAAITTLTMSATQTLADGKSSNGATTQACWVYDRATTTWNRFQ
jgi:hypothetical protein